MFEKAAKLNQNLEAAKVAIKAEGKAALSEAFQELFSLMPEIKAIKWRQIYPWCDGDTSYFHVAAFAPVFTPEQLSELTGDTFEDEDEVEDYAHDYFGEGFAAAYRNPLDPTLDKLVAHFRKFEELIMNEVLLEMTFGAHVEITAFPDGSFAVKPYNEDY